MLLLAPTLTTPIGNIVANKSTLTKIANTFFIDIPPKIYHIGMF